MLDVVQQQALAGDRASQRLLLGLVFPRAKYPTVSFDLPEKIDTPEALAEVSAEIFRQIADGNIPPEQGRILMSLLKDHSVNLESLNVSKANDSGADAKLLKAFRPPTFADNASGADAKILPPYRPPTMADFIKTAKKFEKDTGWPASDIFPADLLAQYEQGILR